MLQHPSEGDLSRRGHLKGKKDVLQHPSECDFSRRGHLKGK